MFDKLQWMTIGVTVMLLCVLLFQKHFDSAQYESHREDGLQKLRSDAVPMVCEVAPTAVEKLLNQKQFSKQGTCQTLQSRLNNGIY